MERAAAFPTLLDAVRSCRRHFVAAAVFSALLNILFLAPTLYMLQVYDRVTPTRGHLTLLFLTIAFVVAIAALSLLDLVRSRLLVRAGARLERRLAGALLDATLSRPASEAITRQGMREFDTLRQTLTGVGVLALFDAPWAPLYILACFIIHPYLGVFATVSAAILVGLALMNERATRDRMKRANTAATTAYVSQDFTAVGADVIRALGMRRAMVRRHLNEREAASRLQAEASFAAGGYMAATRFCRLVLQSLALGLGAWLAIEQKISAGGIFAASLLVSRALAPIEVVMGAWRSLLQARGAWRLLDELLQRASPDVSMTQLPPPSGALQVERLGVLNPARDGYLLRGVSFRLSPGEIIGVVGPSGAGKTTLLRAIAGAGRADDGGVRFDGAEARDWDPERLARYIGYLPQESLLFAGTVKENIARFRTALGEDAAVIDQMAVEAAQRCGAHEMILRLPRGYDTVLEFGGRGLSAGQAQRIALARALFGAPPLLLLDEPNAHLDAEGEALLVATLLDCKARGASVLIVAHRTGVLSAVDKLMVLRDGALATFGARDEVLMQLAPPAPRPLEGATVAAAG